MSSRRLPSLSALRAFEAAARHESAKQAALELAVTATAISHQIRGLEEALGITLFVRKPRQLELTPQGRELQQVLESSFDNISSTIARLSAMPKRRSVTLTTTPVVAVRWLLPWVCLLRESHPDIDLRIHASHEPVAIDGITADLAIRHGDGRWSGLVAEKLFDTTLIPVCSPQLAQQAGKDALKYPLIHFRPQGVFISPTDWPGYQKIAQVPGLVVSAGLAFSDESHAIAAAVGGQGVMLMSRQLIEDELADGRLIQPFGPELEDRAFFLVYPESRRNDPTILATRDWVMAVPGRLLTSN
ncbi:LysR substrate-binding domain-containing protein [Vreelandella populi]|uniref:LysR family transcriptional regulator n=1 Tax=Vreelandella populi TaxID=2498858 RepID=A0A3S0WMJ0_9GAMM|nr:LysR substrate-binding domain-containing protein [Halomonas populi]RUR36522.1 LysR family transcriptional regulator [Halomonas populi]RUR44983.1 LysR family transcriptional regulator [Halomonas populi]RUR51320.1 LysR family transcriptional regulator [Halomonas populi]